MSGNKDTLLNLTLETNLTEETNGTLLEESSLEWVPLDTFIGLVLAFSSCFFIGISVIYKKLALRDIEVGTFFFPILFILYVFMNHFVYMRIIIGKL